MTSRISSELSTAIKAYAQQSNQQVKSKATETVAAVGLPADKVDLSPQAVALARDLAVATKIIREADTGTMSPQRKAYIDELALRIAAGNYQPSVMDVAERLAPALRILEESPEK
ncbi:MAG: flagellar biosynthesis anti-sigma factor FlgM [Symbiobacteriaceae bacterium]|nr:flagellar biosynthesis anti-sigma factor FlgM [Symbiobacteriaceae bacterium]